MAEAASMAAMGRSPQTGFSDYAKFFGTTFDKEGSKRPFAVTYAKPASS
jgi:hypothetical protein